MKNFKALNSKEIKKLNDSLKEQFGNEFNFKDYLVFRTPKDRIYIVNRDFADVDISKLRINNIGLYFLTIEKDGVRLSIDGSQIFKAKKNVVELDKKNFKKWMSGYDLMIKKDRGYCILKYKLHFLGCGKSSGEKIIGYIPKERRVVFE